MMKYFYGQYFYQDDDDVRERDQKSNFHQKKTLTLLSFYFHSVF